MKKSELKNIISEEIRVALVSENTDVVISVLRQIKDDDARSLLWDAYQNGHLSADKVVQIAKDTGGLRESSQDLFNNLRREIKEMVAIANAKNKDILGTEPLEVSVKPRDNFFFVKIKYPTGQGFLGFGGEETMTGQRRRIGAEVSKQVGEQIKDHLEKNLTLEDSDVNDDERGTVTVFAVGDEFMDMIGERKIMKEYTDRDFSGEKIFSQIKSPDMFGREAFEEFFPVGMASEEEAINSLKVYDKKFRSKPRTPGVYYDDDMSVHVQYHEFQDAAGEKYRAHQTQYYHSDDDRNPSVTAIALTKLADPDNPSPQSQEDKRMGTVLVKTGEYVKDLNDLDITNKAMQEVYSEKQRRWACAQDDPKFDEMCKDTAISKKKVKETILKVLKNG